MPGRRFWSRTLAPVAAGMLIAAMTPLGRQAFAQCPADTISACGVTSISSAPSNSAFGCTFNSSGASYNLTAGTIAINAVLPNGYVRLRTEDIFTISGPASPLPIQGTMKLTAKFIVQFQSSLSLTLSSGGQSTNTFEWNSTSLRTLTVLFVHPVGEPFSVVTDGSAESHVSMAGVDPRASVVGSLAFALPPGYAVTSCQGFSSAPTPDRATTWGAVKTTYR